MLRAASSGLAPVLTIVYGRSTLLDMDADARLTCDSDLVWVAPSGATVALPGPLLLETKSTGPPTTADRLLWRAGHHPLGMSKYCVGLAALNPALPANKWNQTLRRHLGWSPQRAST